MPRITKRLVDQTRPPRDRDLFIWDDQISGFGLRVKPSGAKSYMIQYRNAQGRSRKLTLGRHGTLTPEEARRMARQHLAAVERGEDPAETRHLTRSAPTVNDLAADYLKHHGPKKRPSSLRNDQAMLHNVIQPKLGRIKVKDVSKREIEKLHLSLGRTPYRANRVLALLSKMFSLAESWTWITRNPVRGIAKFTEGRRERWLSEEELSRLLAAIDQHPNRRAANAVRLMLLTGARKTEVLTARWDQFDLQRGVWTKAAHFTKQKRSQHLPLSEPAIHVVLEMSNLRQPNDVYLFPGDVPNKPLQDIKKFWRSILKAAEIKDARLHDLRHTFASYLVSSGHSLALVGRLLGHTQVATTQRYAHLADDPLRAATSAFGEKIADLARLRAAHEIQSEKG